MIWLWQNPAEAAVWAHNLGSRKVFMLDRNLQPTIFTLGMGLVFTGLSLIGMFRFVTGKGPVR